MSTMVQKLVTARKVSTPVVLITTTDQTSSIEAIAKPFAEKLPIVAWDCLRGFTAVNEAGKAAIAAMGPKDERGIPIEPLPGVPQGINPPEAFTMALSAPRKTLLFIRNAHLLWNEPPIKQGITLIRDMFRQNQRTLVMLAPAAMLPGEVVQDVVVIDDPLPGPQELEAILDGEVANITETLRLAGKEFVPPTAEEKANIIGGLRGLTAYAAESVTALSIAETERVDPKVVWRRKRDIVGQVKGIKWNSDSGTLADLGGLHQIKEFAEALFAGANPPDVIVRVDEIEKAIAGFGGDNTGVSQDQVGTLLREMEDNGWGGLVAVGGPGTGKSAFTKLLGATYGRPTIEIDLGAAKGGIVGESEANIRALTKVLKAIGGSRVFWVATCNKLDILPPELRRRFKYGVWYFDLPTDEEKKSIWDINIRQFELPLPVEKPVDKDWTGAEIRNVCEMARDLRKQPDQVSHYIVPVSVADPASIERLRTAARGKFLSASTKGAYGAAVVEAPEVPTGNRRYAFES